MHTSLKDKLKTSVQRSKMAVFLRSDFVRFGSYRQVTRALDALQREHVLIRVGHGLYMKPEIMDDLPSAIQKVRSRLPSRRVKRHVTVGDTTVLLGLKSSGRRNAQTELDKRKLETAKEVLQKFPLAIIRQKSLANLDRWGCKGVWASAHDEWRALMRDGTDTQIIEVMTGENEAANRLRQSPPYTGLRDDKFSNQRKSRQGKSR